MPDLNRFLETQEKMYDVAFSEIKDGRKTSHWIWFVFPQVKGLGHSHWSNYFGIDGLDEAKEYLSNDVLRRRLENICKALLEHDDDIHDIMGGIDSLKLRSSMTLFDAVSPNDIYGQVLDKFYNGSRDKRTLSIINR